MVRRCTGSLTGFSYDGNADDRGEVVRCAAPVWKGFVAPCEACQSTISRPVDQGASGASQHGMLGKTCSKMFGNGWLKHRSVELEAWRSNLRMSTAFLLSISTRRHTVSPTKTTTCDSQGVQQVKAAGHSWEGSASEAMAPAANEQLAEAAQRGQLDEVKKLLQSRADLESRNEFSKRTPLHWAANNGHRDVVQLLLEKNAEIETKNVSASTPLHLAAEEGQRDVVQLLLEKKAQIETKNVSAKTPLHFAAQNGHRDVVQLLLEKNAEIETKDDFANSPLHVAAENGHRDVVQLLLEKKAQIETKNVSTKTPLHLAAQNGQRDVVQLLLEKKAQIETTTEDGETPLSIAIDFRNSEVVDVLLDHIPKEAWSWFTVCQVLKLDNQETVVKFLDLWPQKAKAFFRYETHPKSMKRAQLPERLRPVLALKLEPGWVGRFSGGPLQADIGDAIVHGLNLRFGEQNLFWAQEVAVTLKVLPGVVGSDAVSNDFLQILADTPHDAVFETDAVQAMILAAWQQERIFTWLEIGSCITTVMALCCSSYGFRHGLLALATTTLWLAAILHAKKTFDEVLQVSRHLLQVLSCQTKRSYINFDNTADIWYIVSGWVAIDRQLVVFPSSLEKPWMAMFCAFSWLRLLYCLRGETWMGPRLLPILSAIKDTFAFFVLMSICLAAAAHAYYNLGVRDEPTPTYAAFMQVIRLGVFGDFDMFEFEGLDPTYALKGDDADQIWEPQDPAPGPDYVWVHALFYTIGLGITVLLMNVLIGVLGANYERYEDRAVGQFFRARVNMLVELQCRPLRNVAKFRGGVRGWISFCFRLLRNTLFAICSPCFLLLIALSCIFCRYSGVMYICRCAFGRFDRTPSYTSGPAAAASECRIFFVVRDEPDINDVRSLRTELRRRIDGMQETLDTKIEKHFAEMRELISGQTQSTQRDSLMEDQIEFRRSQNDPVSPQEVELDSLSRSSQDVSPTEETKGVTKLTPKVKKKARKVKRQTKTSPS